MQQMQRLSFDLNEIRAIKAAVSGGAACAERISLGFAFQLFLLKQNRREDYIVLREIDGLEGSPDRPPTKKEEQFRRAPLHPLWHKHFSAPRHFVTNIGIRWGVDKNGNRDLTKMIVGVAAEHGDNPDLWQKLLAYKFGLSGYQDRVTENRLTGDWIIFAKHQGKNFYLGLATHEEGQSPDCLMKKLRDGSECEFPFLFL